MRLFEIQEKGMPQLGTAEHPPLDLCFFDLRLTGVDAEAGQGLPGSQYLLNGRTAPSGRHFYFD